MCGLLSLLKVILALNIALYKSFLKDDFIDEF